MLKFWHLESKFEKRKLVQNSRFPQFWNVGLFRNCFWSFRLVSGGFGWFRVLVSTIFIARLPLFLDEVNMCIAIVCWPFCDVISFEINLFFLIKRFSYLTKISRQKVKYLEREKSFQGEIKSIFKRLSVAKNCLRPESAPLINKNVLEWFLLIISKEDTLSRYTKFFSRDHPKLSFDKIKKVYRQNTY